MINIRRREKEEEGGRGLKSRNEGRGFKMEHKKGERGGRRYQNEQKKEKGRREVKMEQRKRGGKKNEQQEAAEGNTELRESLDAARSASRLAGRSAAAAEWSSRLSVCLLVGGGGTFGVAPLVPHWTHSRLKPPRFSFFIFFHFIRFVLLWDFRTGYGMMILKVLLG